MADIALETPARRAIAERHFSIHGHETNLSTRILAILAAYIAVLKPRSLSLNGVSALTGVVLASGSQIPWSATFILLLSGGLVTAGCGALNSYLERDIDALMVRTSQRPLPSGRIKPAANALVFGLLLTAVGLTVSILWLNVLATLSIAMGATIYILVYTAWLKRRTTWSVVAGSLSGSCALWAGWFAATTYVGMTPLLLGLFIALWSMAHFWSLAIRDEKDNRQAGIPALPLVYGERAASRLTSLLNVALVLFSIFLYALEIMGRSYLTIVVIAGSFMLLANLRLLLAPNPERAWTVFKFSSPYLAIIYLAMCLDVLLS